MRVEPEKLISALIASHPGMKLDYNAIARAYGDGANYNTIEHKFRRYRKEAEQLRAQAQADSDSPATFLPQPRVGKAQRARQTRSEATSTPSSKTPRRKSTKVKKPSPIVLSDSDDVPSPIKPEVKRENDATRALLGINNIPTDDEQDLPSKKRKRESPPPADLNSVPSFEDVTTGPSTDIVGNVDYEEV